jgi:(p)ppGpp synthase/HD superfamily hydrolase
MEDNNNWQSKFNSCFYSSKLMDKLLLINEKKSVKDKIDLVEIQKAIYYAKKYHGDQKRQSGEVYYSHPIEVAYMVSDYIFRTDIIVTAILHDTIEDTDLTFEMIKTLFGNLVAEKVNDLTRIKDSNCKITSTQMVESLFQQKKYDVLLIKQFDRLHNMQTIGVKSSEKIQKILNETAQTFLVLSEFLEIPNARQELAILCDNLNPFKSSKKNSRFDDEYLISLIS